MKASKLDAEAWLNRQVEKLEDELRRLGVADDEISRCRTLGQLIALKERELRASMAAPKGR